MEKSNNEDKHIENLFKSVDIPQIPYEQIESVVKVAADYLPVGRKHMSLWDMTILHLRTTSVFFWAACAALMAVAILFISSAESSFSAAGIFVVAAPAPLLFSLLEMMTTRTPNVIELEKVCKYNVNQLYVLKIMVGTILNIGVLALISVFSLHTLNSPLQMFLLGSIIMLTIGFLALLVATTLGQSLPVMGILASWTIAASMLFDNVPKLAMALLSIRFTPLLITLLVSTMFFILALHIFSHKFTTLSLGGI
jgi:hypothetical protein